MTAKDAWNPDQYARFKQERERPFYDLLKIIQIPITSAVDLGCGIGELSLVLHKNLQIQMTLGIDSSPAMLANAFRLQASGITFKAQRIEDWQSQTGLDLIFSNAALQWVPNHPSLLARCVQTLNPGGQLAIQMPYNQDHRTHTLAAELGRESPFVEALQAYQHTFHILTIEDYAKLFNELGLIQNNVIVKVYGHPMPSSLDLIEWVKGTLLTAYKSRLPEKIYEQFLAEYSRRLIAELGTHKPYFYPFKRIFLWAIRT